MNEVKTNIQFCRIGENSLKNFHVHYDTIECYGNFNKKISLGQDFKCRFCGTSDRRKFKKDNAHAIPKFTGNKWLFSKRECTDCNEVLSIYEGELANHGVFNRTMIGMKYKNGNGPKFTNDLFCIQNVNGILNFKIDNTKNKTEYESIFNIKANFETDEYYLEFTPPRANYITSYIYKALCKIAITLLPDNDFNNVDFDKFKKWILNKEIEIGDYGFESPTNIVFYNNFGLREVQPLSILSKKNNRYNNFICPQYSFLFGFAGLIYQIYIPFVKADCELIFKDEIQLLVVPELIITKNDKASINILNGSNSKRTNNSQKF